MISGRIDALGRALQPSRHTLETLNLFIHDQDYYWAAEGLETLRNFTALKKPWIQSQVLLGEQSALRNNGVPTLLLSQILPPPSLEDLTIHCCEHDYVRTDGEEDLAHHVEVSLDGQSFSIRIIEPDETLVGRDRRVTESVVVCLFDAHISDMPVYRSLGLQKFFNIVGRKVGLPCVKEKQVSE